MKSAIAFLMNVNTYQRIDIVVTDFVMTVFSKTVSLCKVTEIGMLRSQIYLFYNDAIFHFFILLFDILVDGQIYK